MPRKPWLLIAALLLTSAFANATCNTVTVADTLYDDNGNLLNGSVTIVNTMTITGADGCVVPAYSSKKATVTAGVLSVGLVPNSGSTPTGTYYTAEYHVSSKYFSETWTVPSGGGPVGLSSVRALTPPVPTVIIAASQIAAPTPCLSAQVFTWNGSAWGCSTPSGITTQTNGVNNTSQTTLNIQNGTGATATNPSAGNVQVSVNYGSTAGTAAQGNDSRITGAEQAANKDAVNGYAGLDASTKLKCTEHPALTGDITASAGSCSTTLPNIVTGNTFTKITYNAKGQVTSGAAAACGDLSNASASCSTDTTNAGNISSGSLPAAQNTAMVANSDQGYFVPTSTIPTTQLAGAIVASNNQVRVLQVVLPFKITVAKITAAVTTLAAGSTCDVGMYSVDGTTKLINAGGFSGAAVATVTTSVTPVTLNPGPYYFAWTCSDATVGFRGIGFSTEMGNILNNQTVKKVGTAANAGSAGVLPSSLGAITGFGGITHPIVAFER